MNNKSLRCENCNSKMEHRIIGSTQGVFCTKCDFCIITSYIKEELPWNDSDENIFNIFYMVNKSSTFPTSCSSCKTKNAHIYMHRIGATKKGTVWTWCSNCKICDHARMELPSWWKNCGKLNFEYMGVHPIMLESKKSIVDNHINSIIKALK